MNPHIRTSLLALAHGAMTSDQRSLVQESLGGVIAPLAEKAGPEFYRRLFAGHPDVEKMFTKRDKPEEPMSPEDIKAQAGKLMAFIVNCANFLDQPDALIACITPVAEAHRRFRNLTPANFTAVGVTFIATLEWGYQQANATFTDELRSAWTAFSNMIAMMMMIILGIVQPATEPAEQAA